MTGSKIAARIQQHKKVEDNIQEALAPAVYHYLRHERLPEEHWFLENYWIEGDDIQISVIDILDGETKTFKIAGHIIDTGGEAKHFAMLNDAKEIHLRQKKKDALENEIVALEERLAELRGQVG